MINVTRYSSTAASPPVNNRAVSWNPGAITRPKNAKTSDSADEGGDDDPAAPADTDDGTSFWSTFPEPALLPDPVPTCTALETISVRHTQLHASPRDTAALFFAWIGAPVELLMLGFSAGGEAAGGGGTPLRSK